MKLPLATGLLSAAAFFVCAPASSVVAACHSSSNAGGSGATTSRFVMRVDRTYDRTRARVNLPSDELPAASYTSSATPVDRWNVSIDGSKIVLTAIGTPTFGKDRLEGKEAAATVPGERRFDIDEGTFAGGRFIVRGEEAELTVFGSGVPVIASERGKLVAR